MLALQLAVDAGHQPKALLTMLDESGNRTRSHGLPLSLLDAQAKALGLPLVTRSAAWTDYEGAFIDGLGECASTGCATCVFGDIDIEAHRRWCQHASAQAGIQPLHPLWQRDRREIVAAFLRRGFEAVIVVVRNGLLDQSFLGRTLGHDLVNDLEQAGVDLCGENGEFHTLVVDGPLFGERLQIRDLGILSVADCSVLDVVLDTVETPRTATPFSSEGGRASAPRQIP
jgi:diphthine-ammonia ligase